MSFVGTPLGPALTYYSPGMGCCRPDSGAIYDCARHAARQGGTGVFDFTRKRQMFEWWDAGFVDTKARNLKSVQDAWIMAELGESKGLTIAEIGGGDSRLLRHLAPNNTCVNIDKLEGFGKGPKKDPGIEGVRTVRSYMGEFDESLEDGSFDVVFSISVIEHVPDEMVGECFADMARLLKPGGRMLHAIDIYLYDEPTVMARIDAYRSSAMNPELRLAWAKEPVIGEKTRFHTDYVSNSDHQLSYTRRLVKGTDEQRATMQVCNIMMELIKQ